MSIFTGLLFQHGHIADVELARSLDDTEQQAREQQDAACDALRRKREHRNRARMRLALRGAAAMSLFR